MRLSAGTALQVTVAALLPPLAPMFPGADGTAHAAAAFPAAGTSAQLGGAPTMNAKTIPAADMLRSFQRETPTDPHSPPIGRKRRAYQGRLSDTMPAARHRVKQKSSKFRVNKRRASAGNRRARLHDRLIRNSATSTTTTTAGMIEQRKLISAHLLGPGLSVPVDDHVR